MFIDCSYEGDLMAKSGVSYTWGRESREEYGESLGGVRPILMRYDIDPYVKPGDPKSGLLPFVQDIQIGPLGSAMASPRGFSAAAAAMAWASLDCRSIRRPSRPLPACARAGCRCRGGRRHSTRRTARGCLPTAC